MTQANLTLRTLTPQVGTTKGSALTHQELDQNLKNLANVEVSADTTPQLGGNLDVAGWAVTSTSGANVLIQPSANGWLNLLASGSGGINIGDFDWLTADGTAGDVIVTDGDGVLSFASPGIADVVEDTTPQLGGELAGQGNTVSNINLKDYKEVIYALSYASTITPDVQNANIQTITLTGNVTLNAFTNPESGQSLTLIVKQDATGNRILSSTMLFAGGSKTLSTAANSVDVITVFYDGTNYLASLAKGFA